MALARKAGFARISADLIYGLPSQTLTSLQDTLERLADTGIEHISVYGLIVEDGTPLASLVDKGRITLPDDDTAADMYELVQSFLRERGFERYEISNYAKTDSIRAIIPFTGNIIPTWPSALLPAALMGKDGVPGLVR